MVSDNQIQSFVIMPFSETMHKNSSGVEIAINSDEWKYIFDNWIRKAVESFPDIKINCKRSETISGNFIKGIINDIYNSEIAIVDLTGQKPNVYYELGIRHALKLGTIIITQDFKALPSDLNSYYCVSYSYTNKSHEYEIYFKKFEEDLHFQIRAILQNSNQSDNPVADYLNLQHYFQVRDKEKQLKSLFKVIDHLQFYLLFVFQKFQAEISGKEELIKNRKIFFNFIDFYFYDNLISKLFNFEFENINEEKVEKLRTYYLEFRRELFLIHQYWEGTRQNIGENNIKSLFNQMEIFLNKQEEFVTNLKNISDLLAEEI